MVKKAWLETQGIKDPEVFLLLAILWMAVRDNITYNADGDREDCEDKFLADFNEAFPEGKGLRPVEKAVWIMKYIQGEYEG